MPLRHPHRLVWLALAASAAQAASAATPSAVVAWNQAALAEVRLSRLSPPVVARALAVAHTCMYDAWVPYAPPAFATVVVLPRRPAAERNDANKGKAISHAAYGCLLNLFPAGATRLQAVMTGLGHNPADSSLNPALPQGLGNLAAQAVIASRRHDGANQYADLAPAPYADYTGYAPGNAPMPYCLPTTAGNCNPNVADPYSWQPLVNNTGAVQVFAAPHWERVRPFALTSASQFDGLAGIASGPNYLQGPSNYQADINQMLSFSANLTLAQKVVVEYWADGPASELPPGHWGLLAQQVSRRDANGVDDDVKLYFAMHNASFDAGIAAWHLKRKYNGVRPITGVRYFKQGQTVAGWGGPGQGTLNFDGSKWTPYNPGSNLTPTFPGFVSGHSTFSAASAAVLRGLTGSDNFGYATVIPAGFGRVEPNVPPAPVTLSYPTFTAAVAEAGMSRLYAGIHFADDNTRGQTLGDQVGRQALAKAQGLFKLGSGLVAEYLFDSAGNGVTPDSSGNGHALTLNPGAGVVAGGASGGALQLVGASLPYGATTSALVNTSGSFSVSGWIRFDQLPACQNQALASQDGTVIYGFLLGIEAPCNGSAGNFRFAMRAFDGDTATRFQARSAAVPAVGGWTHLVGVRDSSAGTLTLYLNGQLQQTVSYPNQWSATGDFAVGRGRFSSQLRDPLYGAVDGVRVHGRALGAAEAALLYQAAQ